MRIFFNNNITLDLVPKRTCSSLGPVLSIFTAQTHFMMGCCGINTLTERWKWRLFPLGHERSGAWECAHLKINTFRLRCCVFLAETSATTTCLGSTPKQLLSHICLKGFYGLHIYLWVSCFDRFLAVDAQESRMIKHGRGCSTSKVKSLF